MKIIFFFTHEKRALLGEREAWALTDLYAPDCDAYSKHIPSELSISPFNLFQWVLHVTWTFAYHKCIVSFWPVLYLELHDSSLNTSIILVSLEPPVRTLWFLELFTIRCQIVEGNPYLWHRVSLLFRSLGRNAVIPIWKQWKESAGIWTFCPPTTPRKCVLCTSCMI